MPYEPSISTKSYFLSTLITSFDHNIDNALTLPQICGHWMQTLPLWSGGAGRDLHTHHNNRQYLYQRAVPLPHCKPMVHCNIKLIMMTPTLSENFSYEWQVKTNIPWYPCTKALQFTVNNLLAAVANTQHVPQHFLKSKVNNTTQIPVEPPLVSIHILSEPKQMNNSQTNLVLNLKPPGQEKVHLQE